MTKQQVLNCIRLYQGNNVATIERGFKLQPQLVTTLCKVYDCNKNTLAEFLSSTPLPLLLSAAEAKL